MISIVVPIYNAELYLPYCIDSILAQSYSDFELLLINDGSSDTSLGVCKEYATKDARIKYMSIDNSGANQARKVGVDNAVGDYIMFVDADDSIRYDALENIMGILEKDENVDVIVAHMPDLYKKVSGGQYIIDLLNSACWKAMCFKIYKTKIIKNNFIYISSFLKYGEDLLQNINIAKYIDCVVYCNIEFYNYRVVESSVSHTMLFSQHYENEYHRFLRSILFMPSFWYSLPSDIASNIYMAWYKSRLNGLRNVALYSSSFDFIDSEFVELKSMLKPYVSNLSIDERILLYSNPRICILLLKSYMSFCKFKKTVKKSLRRIIGRSNSYI